MCGFVCGFCLALGLSVCWACILCLSVCPSVQVMFGMGFVCLSVCKSYVWHGVCLFVRLYKLCLARGLSVCTSEQVMFGMGFVCPSEQVMFGTGFVCLSVCTSYVWHGVCLFVHLYNLCLAWGLSVASIAH